MKNTEQNKKEAGLTERFSSKENFILPREFAIYPFFSGEKSDVITKREITVSDFGKSVNYEIQGPTLNKFDFSVMLSVLKLIDNQSYNTENQRQEFWIEYCELFDLLCLSRTERRLEMKDNIGESLRRIKQLTITIKKAKGRGWIAFNMLDEVEAGDNLRVVLSQRFIDFFRESTQEFIVHIDHKKFDNLNLDAARLYLFLKANKNLRFINRNALDAIFQLELESVETEKNEFGEFVTKIIEVAECDANKRFKSSTAMLGLDVTFEKKNRKTSKLTFNKYPNL